MMSSGTDSGHEPAALLSAYGQKRLAASIRITRWVLVGVGVLILGFYTFIRRGFH